MKEILSRLQSRRAAVQGEFDALNKERDDLIEQNRKIQRRLEEINVGILRLQGRFAEIQEEDEHIKGIEANEKKLEEEKKGK